MDIILLQIIFALIILFVGFVYGIKSNKITIGGDGDGGSRSGDSLLSMALIIGIIIAAMYYLVPEELRITNLLPAGTTGVSTLQEKGAGDSLEIKSREDNFTTSSPKDEAINFPEVYEDIAPATNKQPDSPTTELRNSIIQMQAFASRANAEQYKATLDSAFPTTIVYCSDGLYRVGYGWFTMIEAAAFKKARGLKEYVVTFD